MQLTSAENADFTTDATFDPMYENIVVVVNCSPEAQTFPFPAKVRALELHPAMADCADLRLKACSVTKEGLTVAPRCAAVFVQPRV